ncbi:hypothetical protein L6452_43438 [Arctium lappa]|uniref:Uncharacterized protein n=1 Tax=Arctium lappa TaxID=4217 RepID=A0ACB8XCJ2_ARCLA|nr:hypothetical protein L6452_43438 [Arctium lappa]
MLDISDMKIQIKITQCLSPGINYRVHLVFKFCGPRKSLAKRMYVNLKYKRESENLNAYFATWREDGWMMIELCRFSCDDQEDIDFKVLLESFSRCYAASRAIYVEGIEIQAIDDASLKILFSSHYIFFRQNFHVLYGKFMTVKIFMQVRHGDEKLKEVQPFSKSNSSMDIVQHIPNTCEEIHKRSENYGEAEKFKFFLYIPGLCKLHSRPKYVTSDGETSPSVTNVSGYSWAKATTRKEPIY